MIRFMTHLLIGSDERQFAENCPATRQSRRVIHDWQSIGLSTINSEVVRVRQVARWMPVVLLAVLSAGCYSSSGEGLGSVDPDSAILTVEGVRLHEVNRRESTKSFSGLIVANRVAELSLEVGGKVADIHAVEGKPVEEGETLLQLDVSQLDTEERELVARRQAAAALLSELKAGARPDEIDAAKAKVEGLQARYDLSALQLGRRKILLEKRSISQEEYDAAFFSSKAARDELRASNHELSLLEAGPREERIAAQEAVVAQLDAQLARVNVTRRQMSLQAPFPGTLTRRLVTRGEIVAPGQPVFQLVQAEPLEVHVRVPGKVAKGLPSKAASTVRVGEQVFPVTLQSVTPVLDGETRTTKTIWHVQTAGQTPPYPGELGHLELVRELPANGIWLPTEALSPSMRGLWSCFKLVRAEADTFEVVREDVVLIHSEETRVLVQGPLESQSLVIATGTHRVVPGQRVRLAESSNQTDSDAPVESVTTAFSRPNIDGER